MDAPLPPDARAELADLRRRAYGPGADIHSDDSALARLHELEEHERVASEMPAACGVAAASSTAEVLAEASTPAAATLVAAHADAERQEFARPETTIPASRSRPTAWWRRLPVWVLLVGTAVVGVAIGMGLPRLSTTAPAATVSPDESSHLEPDFLSADTLEFFGLDADSMVPYEMFQGSRAWSGVNSSGHRCLFIAVKGLWVDGGCTPVGLPPQAEYVVYAELATVNGNPTPGNVVRYVQRPGGLIDVWVNTLAD